MQTLKTAIVVLLMMTVMYGSYVSLTTPPEAMPDAVASLIQDSDSFDLAIDDGLPESTPSFSVDAGQALDVASVGPDAPTLDFAPPPFPEQVVASEQPSFNAPDTFGSPNQMAVIGSLSDSAMTLSSAGENLNGVDRLADLQLPKPDAMAALPKIDPTRDYPVTGPAEMTLPDPNSLLALPDTGWNKEATPVSFELPAKPNQSDLAPAQESESNLGLANAIRTADRQYAADQHYEALATLSLFYNTPNLSETDRNALISRLDPLAASVIYSRKHLLEQPHRVAANETLMEIASRFDLPWQLLANINGIDDPVSVLPGTELKVLRGPFRAEVNLQRNELTIFLADLYAGRFPIAVGTEPTPEVGIYTIQDKQSARTFYDKNGSPVPPGDSRNPYGVVWMDLGKQICIHGSPDRAQPTDRGCISLRGADAEDLYGILSQGSSVTIRR